MGILDDAIREHLELKRRHGADTNEVARQEREILGANDTSAAGFEAAAPVVPDYDADYEEHAAPTAEPLYADPAGDYDEPTSAAPLAGSPLAEPEAPAPAPEQAVRAVDDLFPGTGELLAAAAEHPAPEPAAAEPAPRPAAASPSLGAPAPAGADEETAARSGARRLSDEELAAWRRRLSERADRLAAARPGGAAEAAAGTDPAPASPSAPTPRPATPSAGTTPEPPAYWSGTAGAPATPAGGAPAEPAGAPGVPVDFFDAGDAEQAFAPEKAPEPQPDPDHDVLDETPEFLSDTPEHDRMWFEQRPPRDFDFG